MSGPRLTTRLVLERAESVGDGAGGSVETWAPVATLWGEVRVRTGREARGQAGPVSTTGFRITLRGAPQGSEIRPRPGQRLRDGARVFRVHSVTEASPEARFLLCFCEEELAK